MNYSQREQLFHRRRTNLGLACVPQSQPLMLPPSLLCHQQLCFSGLVSLHGDQNNLGAIYPPNPAPGRLKDSRRILPFVIKCSTRASSSAAKMYAYSSSRGSRVHEVMDLNMDGCKVWWDGISEIVQAVPSGQSVGKDFLAGHLKTQLTALKAV